MANQWLKQYCQFCISPKTAKAALAKAFSVMMLFVCIGGGLNSSAHAGTTTADFLKWERKSQEAFLQNSISMAGVIASQINPEISKCLDKLYFKSETSAKERNQEILDLMPKYAEFRPQAFIMAYVEDICGRFDRS